MNLLSSSSYLAASLVESSPYPSSGFKVLINCFIVTLVVFTVLLVYLCFCEAAILAAINDLNEDEVIGSVAYTIAQVLLAVFLATVYYMFNLVPLSKTLGRYN